MKMSDNMCVQKTETGFLTNCRLCLNESNFPILSIFDDKYKDDDLARKIMLLTNIVVSFKVISPSFSGIIKEKCGHFYHHFFVCDMITIS